MPEPPTQVEKDRLTLQIINLLQPLSFESRMDVLQGAISFVAQGYWRERGVNIKALAEEMAWIEAEASVALSNDPACQTHSGPIVSDDLKRVIEESEEKTP